MKPDSKITEPSSNQSTSSGSTATGGGNKSSESTVSRSSMSSSRLDAFDPESGAWVGERGLGVIVGEVALVKRVSSEEVGYRESARPCVISLTHSGACIV